MNVLGIRCSSSDYTFAVLSGTKTSPQVVEVNSITFPTGFAKPQSLKWFYQEIDDLLARNSVQKIVIKKFEGRTRGNTYEARVEHEAMISLAGANHGVKPIFKKVKSTIAKDLGMKGRAHYLSTFDTSPVSDFREYSQKAQDALLAGWSELR